MAWKQCYFRAAFLPGLPGLKLKNEGAIAQMQYAMSSTMKMPIMIIFNEPMDSIVTSVSFSGNTIPNAARIFKAF
jgi:hypothetical protein